jgi:SNF2 family DNA or RNA helicase
MVDRGLFLLTAGVGTGKSPMTIAAVEELHEEFGDDFCGIVVCAGGLKHQWRDQIAQFTGGTEDSKGTWTGGAPCIVIDGGPDKRWELYERVLAEKPRWVILGYDQVVDDHNKVIELPQMFVVSDEVTTIKNPAATITQAFRAAFSDAPFRFGLTGTPTENGRPEEMFQLMVWVDDTVLGRVDLFDQTFCKRNRWGKVTEYVNLPLFHEMMSECSVSLDPDDPDVAPYMPTMATPRRVLIELDAETARIYNEVMSPALRDELAEASKKTRGGFDLFAHYAGDSGDATAQGRIMSKISCMRMLLAHPDQLINSAYEWLAASEVRERDPEAWPTVTKTRVQVVKGRKTSVKIKVPKSMPGSAYAAQLLDAGELDALDETPKLDEVVLDITEVLAGECWCCRDTVEHPELTNKVVVFSYHKLVLRILEKRFGAVSVRYDGDMTLKKRNEHKKRFQRDPDTRLFLTSDAGGYGVDLPQANHLFNLDKPFTAGRVTQRNARVRRANLDFHDAVHVRDYLIDGSIEIFYADVTDAKQRVAQAMRTGRGTVKGGIKMSADSLRMFLTEHKV